MKKTELLAPAGNMEVLIKAIDAGADAIYVGGSNFSARAYAENFDKKQLKKAINDETYKEWVDGIIASEENYDLKATLPNIINKFADMRIVNQELSTRIYIPLKDYVLMVLITIISIPLPSSILKATPVFLASVKEKK